MGLLWSCLLCSLRHDSDTRAAMRIHRRQHRVMLLKDALPVFVAASISRAILSVLLVISDGVSSTLVAFLYTFVLCHSTGAALTAFLPEDLIMIHYFQHLITETVGFAWKESALLLIVDQISVHHNLGLGIGAWCTFVVFAICFVAFSTLLAIRLNLSAAAERALAIFTSEVFALSIAYTFTVIIAFLVYWQQRDDTSSYAADDDDKDGDSERTSMTAISHCLFMAYTFGLTYIIAIMQSYNEDKYARVDKDTPPPPVEERETTDHNAGGGGEKEVVPGDREEESKKQTEDFIDAEIEAELANRDKAYTSSEAVMARYVTWDEYFHIHSALFNLLQTTQGYMVGSAWFLWITFTFEVTFNFDAYFTVLGYALFAVMMTYVMARVMSKSSAKLDRLRETGDESNRSFVRRRKRQQLKLAASRITVGWMWENVIAEVFIEIAGIGGHEMTDAIRLAVKCGVAIVLFIIGAMVQYFYFEGISSSTNGDSDHHSGGLSEALLINEEKSNAESVEQHLSNGEYLPQANQINQEVQQHDHQRHQHRGRRGRRN